MVNYIFEGVGTFFLVLTVALTGNPIAIGTVLMCLVYVGAPISGAHYNPAVTFALLLQKKISEEKAKRYILAQMIGGIAASFICESIFAVHFNVTPTNSSWTAALIIELLFTFLLMTTIFRVAVSKKTQGNQYFGLAIGGALLVGAFAGGKISGGAFNPAVGISPLLVNTLLGKELFDPALFFLYIIGPLAGATLAALVHRYTE